MIPFLWFSLKMFRILQGIEGLPQGIEGLPQGIEGLPHICHIFVTPRLAKKFFTIIKLWLKCLAPSLPSTQRAD